MNSCPHLHFALIHLCFITDMCSRLKASSWRQSSHPLTPPFTSLVPSLMMTQAMSLNINTIWRWIITSTFEHMVLPRNLGNSSRVSDMSPALTHVFHPQVTRSSSQTPHLPLLVEHKWLISSFDLFKGARFRLEGLTPFWNYSLSSWRRGCNCCFTRLRGRCRWFCHWWDGMGIGVCCLHWEHPRIDTQGKNGGQTESEWHEYLHRVNTIAKEIQCTKNTELI